MKTSETIGDLAGALSKAQGEIKGAVKDSKNPFFKSSYADLSSVWNACREALSKNSLAVIQTCSMTDHGVCVSTRLTHASGQWVEDDLTVMPVKTDPQGIGSTITYLRRYALAAITGVAPEDDDGNAASSPKEAESKFEQPRTQNVKIANEVKNKVHEQTMSCLEKGDEHGIREIWSEFDADQTVVLWPMFTSQQRSSIRKMLGLV